MTLDPQQLFVLLAIARHGSFGRAAIALGQSQPTLSNNIALLERKLGVKLLERSRRGSKLTTYGEILVRRTEGIAAILDDAESEVRNFDSAIAGPLRVGATPGALPTLLPQTLARLGSVPGARIVEVLEGLDHALTQDLRTGRLDIFVGPVRENLTGHSDIVEHVLLEDPFCIAVPPDNALADRDCIQLNELGDAQWVLPREGSTYRRHVEAMFLTAGVPWPAHAVYANSLPLLEAMIASGGYVTFVSPLQLRFPVAGFRVLRLDHGSRRAIGYKVRRSAKPSHLADRFVDLLIEVADEIARDPAFVRLGGRGRTGLAGADATE